MTRVAIRLVGPVQLQRFMSSPITNDNIINVCRCFKEALHTNLLNRCTEDQIFPRNSCFSYADIHVSLFINRMFTSESNMYAELLIS